MINFFPLLKLIGDSVIEGDCLKRYHVVFAFAMLTLFFGFSVIVTTLIMVFLGDFPNSA